MHKRTSSHCGDLTFPTCVSTALTSVNINEPTNVPVPYAGHQTLIIISRGHLDPSQYQGPSSGGLAWGPSSGGLAWGPSSGGLAWGPSSGGLAWGPSSDGLAWGPSSGGLSWGPFLWFLPHCALDPLGHHAVTCKRGGDVVSHQV